MTEIARYYIEVASSEAAEKALGKIKTAVAKLDGLELPGRPRDELLPGLRSVLASPYVVFFRLGDDSIEIVRVLHQRRNIPALLGGRDD